MQRYTPAGRPLAMDFKQSKNARPRQMPGPCCVEFNLWATAKESWQSKRFLAEKADKVGWKKYLVDGGKQRCYNGLI